MTEILERSVSNGQNAENDLTQEEVNTTFDGIAVKLMEENPEFFQRLALLVRTTPTDNVDANDLQKDNIEAATQLREELLNMLLERPYEAFATDFAMLMAEYNNRSTITPDASGNMVTEFVTRDMKKHRADLHFKAIMSPDGDALMSVEVPSHDPMHEYAEPFTISATLDGELSVEQKIWRQGRFEYPKFSADSEQGRACLKEFLMLSTEAMRQTAKRTNEKDRQGADDMALDMLIEELIKKQRSLRV